MQREQCIQADQITFSYGRNNILEDLSLAIQKGAFVSIIGPNGSGKSTLLKNISAELTPQKGAVLLEDRDIFRIKKKELAQKMAVVPQETGGNFAFSVLDTVLMGRMPHQRRFQADSARDLEIASWAMKITNVWHLRDRTIDELSGGEKQRVIVARALTQEPQILLLDEPTSHLDIQHQLELLELLSELNRSRGLTVIAVLHDLNLAAQFSQEIILLNKGKIMAYGPPEQVLTARNIRESYNIDVVVASNAITGRLNIIPLSRQKESSGQGKGLNIHLICGGGSGSYLMEQLYNLGCSVSCGVLNIGDSDWKKAKELEIAVSEEAPFSPISAEALKVTKDLLSRADLSVILPVPFGRGNLANLRQVLEALEGEHKKVLLVEQRDIAQRDFTGGEATRLIKGLYEKGAEGVDSIRHLLEKIGGI